MAFVVIRLTLYMLVRIFGYEFWIMPDIFMNDAIFPLVTFERADDHIFGFVCRLVLVLFFGYVFWSVYKEPEILKEYSELSTQSYEDVVSWGRLKLGVDKANITFNNAINYSTSIFEENDEDEGRQSQNETTKEGDL